MEDLATIQTIGSWKYYEDSIITERTWTFYENETAKIVETTEEDTSIVWVNYTIDKAWFIIPTDRS